MGSQFINGAKYAVSSVLAAPVAISALSNAAIAVATAAALPAAGSIIVLKSGWTEINELAVRVGTSGSGVFQLEGVNSSNVARFPAGEGIGAYQIASAFVSLSQVRDVQSEGGEQQYFQYQYVEDQGKRQRQKPTYKNASSMTILLDYDPSLAWFDTLVELDRLGEQIVLRETLPNGDVIYHIGTLSFNKVPSRVINENMTVTATFSLANDSVRYDAP